MEVNKCLIKGIMVAFLVLFFIGMPLTNSRVEAKEIKLNMATWGPPKGTIAKALQWYVDEVGKRTDQRVKIKIFWAGSLAKPMELPHAVRTGTADMAAMLSGYFQELFPFAAVGLEVLLLAGVDCGEGTRAYWQLRGEFPEVAGEFEKQNQKLLAVWDPSPVDIVSVNPIKNVGDFKGLKLRAVGSIYPRIFSPVGAVCITMPSPEQYDAMSRGLIKAAPANLETAYKFKLYEVAKYYLRTGFMGTMPTLYGITINLDVWKRLPPDVQHVLKEVAEEYMEKYPDREARANRELEKVFRDNGVEFNTLPVAEQKAWRAKVVRPIYEDYIKRTEGRGYSNARKILDRYCELLKFNPYEHPISE